MIILLVEMELELADSPGQLIKILEPIGKYGGNIIDIIHIRDRKKANNLPVIFNFDVSNIEKLNQIKNDLIKLGIKINRLESEIGAYKGHVILIGHVFNTDIKNTIDQILAIKGVLVKKVSAQIKAPKEHSSVKFLIQADTREALANAYEKFQEISKKKNLLMIKELQ